MFFSFEKIVKFHKILLMTKSWRFIYNNFLKLAVRFFFIIFYCTLNDKNLNVSSRNLNVQSSNKIAEERKRKVSIFKIEWRIKFSQLFEFLRFLRIKVFSPSHPLHDVKNIFQEKVTFRNFLDSQSGNFTLENETK